MDVSTSNTPTARSTIPIYREISCSVCGYPRHGLSAATPCPECGQPPPAMVAAPRPGAMPLTVHNQAWLRRSAIGLILLTICSLSALNVTLQMDIGRYSAPAVNVPAAKVPAAALLQRSIGSQPGPLGIQGVLAVLGTALAVWILTEPRASAGDADSLRQALRWTMVISVGAVLGLTLAWNRMNPGSKTMQIELLAAVGVCELPVNTLLYLYLRRMAESLEIPRAAAALNVCAWLIPLVILLHLCIIPIAAIEDAQQELVWGVFIAAVGAVSLVCGVIATLAVARLIIATAHTGMQQWLAGSQRAIIRTLIASRKLLTSPHSASVYRTVAGGIVLWLATIPWTSAEVLERGGRHASGGDVPYINLLAPKIVIATPAITQWEIYSASHSLLPYLLQALAVWMMTIHPGAGEPRRNRWLRITTRLLAMLGAGAVGWSLGAPPRYQSDLYMLNRAELLTVFTLLCEVPITILLYWHLAAVAERFGLTPLRTRLRLIGIAAAVLIMLPLGFFPFALAKIAPYKAAIAVTCSIIEMTAVIAVGLLAITALMHLSWALAFHQPRRRNAAPIIPDDDPGFANPAAQ